MYFPLCMRARVYVCMYVLFFVLFVCLARSHMQPHTPRWSIEARRLPFCISECPSTAQNRANSFRSSKKLSTFHRGSCSSPTCSTISPQPKTASGDASGTVPTVVFSSSSSSSMGAICAGLASKRCIEPSKLNTLSSLRFSQGAHPLPLLYACQKSHTDTTHPNFLPSHSVNIVCQMLLHNACHV